MPAQDPYVGTLFAGRFLIERLLDAGGMGAVYEAVQQPPGRKVALKLIKGAGVADPMMIARFQREIGVMAGLNHPNIVTLFDCGDDGGNVFLVMELLVGRSLREEIKALRAQGQARVPWERALRIAHHVVRGLAAVHHSGVVHRDLKPANIFMTTSTGIRDFAKLLDFGIVRQESVMEAQSLTKTGGIPGTPGYVSPEQLKGSPASPRSDLYALGVVLYELVTGDAPFKAPTSEMMIAKQLFESVIPPGRLAPGLPGNVEALIMALMSRDPALRPSTDALLQQLEELLSDSSGPVQRAVPHLDGNQPMHATEQMIRPEVPHPPAAPTHSDGSASTGVVGASLSAPVSPAPLPAIASLRPTPETEASAVFAPSAVLQPAVPVRRVRTLWLVAGGGAVVAAITLVAFSLLRTLPLDRPVSTTAPTTAVSSLPSPAATPPPAASPAPSPALPPTAAPLTPAAPPPSPAGAAASPPPK